ncbi:MAG: AAA family ATPase [Armatimonadia bacterium]|nr:AAA family ATPase [Armatimonadia bacterium]
MALKAIGLDQVKGFGAPVFEVGPLTLVLGANAAGKTNLCESVRLLVGLAKGLSLPEVVDGPAAVGAGDPSWRGLRGGAQELVRAGASGASLTLLLVTAGHEGVYRLKLVPWLGHEVGGVVAEEFLPGGQWVTPAEDQAFVWQLGGRLQPAGASVDAEWRYRSAMVERGRRAGTEQEQEGDQTANLAYDLLLATRFIEFEPEALRRPCSPGIEVLGDRGDNLSSVLHLICQDVGRKQALIEWLRELTPSDVVDLKFPEDPHTGRILVHLVEESGAQVSANSASDGTLRFLGYLALFMGPRRPKLVMIDELETGIHPTRIRLLMELLERETAKGDVQVIATTHSPQVLAYASPATLEDAVLLHRPEGSEGATATKLLDVPGASETLEHTPIVRLYESGWFEDALAFAEEGAGA